MISHVRHRRLLLSSHNHYRCRCNTLEKAAHIIPTLKPARCQYHKDKALFSAVFFCCTLPYFCSQLLNFSVLCCLFFFAVLIHRNETWARIELIYYMQMEIENWMKPVLQRCAFDNFSRHIRKWNAGSDTAIDKTIHIDADNGEE